MPPPQALGAAHLADDARARAWLGEPWAGIDTCAARARAFLAAGSWDRAALVAMASSAAPVVARQLADPASAVVVTGQQPAVGGGPLYTLVKTAQAIALAESLTRAGVPTVAWFWCASEDHDLGEANHLDLVLRDSTISRYTADLGSGRAALRWRPAAAGWGELIKRCRQQLGDGLGAAWLSEHAPLGDEGLGTWTCRILSCLFPGKPLVAVEAHQVRRLWRGRLPLAPGQWPEHALANRRSELLQHGYPDSFGELGVPPLFHDLASGRVVLNLEEARHLEPSSPDAISPGAALRPVLQQIALPAVAAILGPGELAYHAAIGPLYPALGAQPPQLVPRCSLTLVAEWVARAAERLGLDIHMLAEGAAPLPQQHADRPQIAALERAISALGTSHDRRIAAAQTRLRRELNRLRTSLERGERSALGLPSPATLAGQLRPCGKPQDRVLGLFQAIWQHGPGLATRILETAGATPPGSHRLIHLRR